MPKVISDNRMELYEQGLTDRSIAKMVGVTQGAITDWRKRRSLQSHQKRERKRVRPGHPYKFKYTGKPMERFLSPAQCESMWGFFRLLITAHNMNPKELNVTRLINFYRDEYGEGGREPIADI